MNALGKNLEMFQNVLLIKVNKKKITNMCTVCEKVHFLPFLAHCTLIRQNNLFFKIQVDQKYAMKQFAIFP